jgi:site-specific recombinase XerD
MHFSGALDAFLSDPRIRGRLKPSTLRAYRTDLQAAALALLAQLDVISPADLRAALAQPIAPSTAARRLAALRSRAASLLARIDSPGRMKGRDLLLIELVVTQGAARVCGPVDDWLGQHCAYDQRASLALERDNSTITPADKLR